MVLAGNPAVGCIPNPEEKQGCDKCTNDRGGIIDQGGGALIIPELNPAGDNDQRKNQHQAGHKKKSAAS